ncbi:DUF7857 domain-containing protein [Halopiger xanaduensis]|uniref:Uncharacterized protein n=1 Tax=Halopiger xanaduensis (strain DSM 18323 / JCM 14033 / SH-6) TaxID=797210 RepID=F8D3P0_HALXS|nr:hypothetical protein [Halopiger xanaduensis]AEH37408.1 hypothetical protein Halxa_2792 [Halopiger xanaduensis SH-6]
MVTIDATCERTNGVTRVRIVVANTRATPQRVRLRCRLEGPLWIPRRDGIADPRWDGDCWTETIRPDRRRGIGVASPAPPTEPLVEVVSSERCESDTIGRSDDVALAELDDWQPTREVLGLERERERAYDGDEPDPEP